MKQGAEIDIWDGDEDLRDDLEDQIETLLEDACKTPFHAVSLLCALVVRLSHVCGHYGPNPRYDQFLKRFGELSQLSFVDGQACERCDSKQVH